MEEEKKIIEGESDDDEMIDILLDLLYGKLDKKKQEEVRFKIDDNNITESMWLGLKMEKHSKGFTNKEEHMKHIDETVKQVILAIEKKTGVKLPRS